MRRCTIVVLDGVGIGALPDAGAYGDDGADSLAHTAQAVGGLRLPHLEELGLGHLAPAAGLQAVANPAGARGRMAERSAGKDSTTGHWEICGIILDEPFPTYPQGFPAGLVRRFEEAAGVRVLGNKAASGTDILTELGEEHLRSGRPILYTSADSVFQLAAHEEVIPPERLYELCQIARGLLTGEHGVARVIARPFRGRPGAFERTAGRRDFSLPPPGTTLLDLCRQAGLPVHTVGKVDQLFAGRGVSRAWPAADNGAALAVLEGLLAAGPEGLILANLGDFDTRYGHRNDPAGYARALEELDATLPGLLARVGPDELLVLTGDHGNDPTGPGTDHTREYVPLLIQGPAVRAGTDVGTRATFADLGQTVAEALGVGPLAAGQSFLREILA